MLPWEKKKSGLAIIISGDQPESEENEKEMAYESAAEEMLTAIEKKDAKALAKAFDSFFALCESYPHEENEDEEKESPLEA